LDPKTIAFGGVATGNIKAQEADKVTANITRKGCISKLSATGERIGSNMAVVAKLEVTSVRKLTKVATKSIKTIMLKPSNNVI